MINSEKFLQENGDLRNTLYTYNSTGQTGLTKSAMVLREPLTSKKPYLIVLFVQFNNLYKLIVVNITFFPLKSEQF